MGVGNGIVQPTIGDGHNEGYYYRSCHREAYCYANDDDLYKMKPPKELKSPHGMYCPCSPECQVKIVGKHPWWTYRSVPQGAERMLYV